MNPQICACLEKLVRIRHPKCLLCFPHRLPLNGRPPTQNRWISHFPEDPNMLWSRVWGRLWRNKGIVHSPKLDKICNIPSHPQCYSRLTLISKFNPFSKRERVTAYGERGGAYRGGRPRDLEMKSAASSSSRATRCSIRGGSSCRGHGRSRSYTGYLHA
jgi:hypothetical protein